MINSAGIRKAVIPVAGMGTRFLPITKTVPKEMLPICNKPLIQYAVEEAAASGIQTVILVVGRGKRVLTEYFQPNPILESSLEKRGHDAEAEAMRKLSQLVEITTVWQDSPQGLAHAIGCARVRVGDEPFVVILPDALIDATAPCARQLMDCYAHHPGCIIATRRIRPEEAERFGVLEAVALPDARGRGGALVGVLSLTERPTVDPSKTRYGIFGRYVLSPEIFGCIEHLSPGFGGEYQLTDALATCSRDVPVYGYCFQGEHFDAGDQIGFLEATLHYALKDRSAAARLRYLLLQEAAPPPLVAL
jgi:UTP--glucose-1-phosphate uridylyltransferase